MSGIMKRLLMRTERAKFEAARALRLQLEQGKLGQLENQRAANYALGYSAKIVIKQTALTAAATRTEWINPGCLCRQ